MKDIQLSREFMTNGIIFFQEENLWKSQFFIDYMLNEECKEDTVTVYYSPDGAVEKMENEDEYIKESSFFLMNTDEGIKAYINQCIKLFNLIKDIKKNHPSGFVSFEYDCDEKCGSFRFNDNLLCIEFILKPGIGVNKLFLLYGTKGEPLYRSILIEHPLNVFGKELTSKIDEWIKKELKLRYFF